MSIHAAALGKGVVVCVAAAVAVVCAQVVSRPRSDSKLAPSFGIEVQCCLHAVDMLRLFRAPWSSALLL